MGISQRKYQHRLDLLSKKLNRPLHLTAETMTSGFKNEDFYNRFRELYPLLWHELEETHEDLEVLNNIRAQKHLRQVPAIPDVKSYLEKRCKAIIANRRNKLSKESSIEEANKLYYKLKIKAKQILAKAEEKERELYAIQKVQPEDFEKLQTKYFELRKQEPLNIDGRLNILMDAAKYKSADTIAFLKKIQNCERNSKLRDYAREALIHMHAPNVWRERKYKGKEKMSYKIEPHKKKTPEELYSYITKKQWQRKMDVFVSHCSIDKDLIISLKDMLNKQGLDCYVDWMYDYEQLSRKLTCKETAAVLIERIKQAKALLYVLTKESLSSIWMPWELGYFSALGKPIYVYKLIDNEIPEYIELYKQVELRNNEIGVIIEGNFTPLPKKIMD